MHRVNRLGYLVLGVTDLAEAVEFYRRFVRLDVTERVDRTVFLTGGPEHHWLRLEEGPEQGLRRIGYEVADEATLADIRARLDESGVPYQEGGDFRSDGLLRYLRFVDPGGFEIDLYVGMAERAVAPTGTGVNIEKFLHGALFVTNYEASIAFYQDVLGFKASDWVGNMGGFFRCGDLYHHSLVLGRALDGRPRFDHFCIQVESIDDVMRFRHNAVNGGVELRDDILRHAPSGSISVYIKDAARGFAVEYCTGHPRVDDDKHRPRVLPMTPETIDVWRAPLPEPAISPEMASLELRGFTDRGLAASAAAGGH